MDTTGQERVLKIFCAEAEFDEDVRLGALERWFHFTLKMMDPERIEMIKKEELQRENEKNCK